MKVLALIIAQCGDEILILWWMMLTILVKIYFLVVFPNCIVDLCKFCWKLVR